MNKAESYALLFTDSLIGNLSINPSSEFVIHSMKTFGNYNILLIFFIVIGTSILSITINYFLGKILKTILSVSHLDAAALKRQKIHSIFHKYNILLLALSATPFCGKFVQVAAGTFDIKYLRVLLISLLFKSIYYSIILLF